MKKFDRSYLRMAQIWAENSYCKRRKVGALLVKNNMIISDGYNGTPSGFENICEDENGVVCDGIAMHRVRQADYPGRNQAGRLS